jgi:hypothetical protein
LETNRSFPTAVVYDHTDASNRHTCVLDFGRVRHWPLRGACWNGERCVLSGPYYNRIGKTYYMNAWLRLRIIRNENGGYSRAEAALIAVLADTRSDSWCLLNGRV